jgi:hypothetical protein
VEKPEFSTEEHLAVPVVDVLLCTLCNPDILANTNERLERLERLLPFGTLKESKAGNLGFQLPFYNFIHLSKAVYNSLKNKHERLPNHMMHYPLNEENHELISNNFFQELPPIPVWEECPHFGPNIGKTWGSLEEQLHKFREIVVFPQIERHVSKSISKQQVNLFLASSVRHARFRDGTRVRSSRKSKSRRVVSEKGTFPIENYSERMEQLVIPMFPIELRPSELMNFPTATDHVMEIFHQIDLLCKGKKITIHTYIASNIINIYSYMHAIEHVFYKAKGFEGWRVFDRIYDGVFRIMEGSKGVKGHQIYQHQLPFEIRKFVEQIKTENQISEKE